jgi:hypothetical protein
MIKTFEQFVNENYNEKNTHIIGEMHAAPLFNEFSEKFINSICDKIDESYYTIDESLVEEGLFDAIGKIFKKSGDKSDENIPNKEVKKDEKKPFLKELLDTPEDGGDIQSIGGDLKFLKEERKKVYEKIDELCKKAEEICEKLIDKEDSDYVNIDKKLTAANEAIRDFTSDAINDFHKIIVVSDGIIDTIASVIMLCRRLADFAKKSMDKIEEGSVLGFSLPFIFAYSICNGVKQLLRLKVQIPDIVDKSFIRINNCVAKWINESLIESNKKLKKACGSIEDGDKKACGNIGKSYIAIVAIFGQLSLDMKDKISDSYGEFINAVKDFPDGVKSYISSKWETVSKWYEKTTSAFAEGVKTIWKKISDKVLKSVGSDKDKYKEILKDEANETWEDFLDWDDEKRQTSMKAKLKYAIDTWGKDTVMDWIKES